MRELIDYSKKNPGKVNYGSSGIGTSVHLSAELFQHMTGVKWVHIAYKGGGPGLVALLAGEVSLYFGNVPTVIRHVRAGKLRGLATTGPKRSPAAPDLPTVAETVPGFEVSPWWGLSAPAGTPPAVIARLNKEFVALLERPDVREQISRTGADPVGDSPDQFAAYIRTEIDKWAKVVKAAAIRID